MNGKKKYYQPEFNTVLMENKCVLRESNIGNNNFETGGDFVDWW